MPLRNEILSLIQQTGLSKWRVAKEVDLDKGNFYRYLNGNPHGLGVDKIDKLRDWLLAKVRKS
ncbi:MAG: hypothetical protein QME66_10450 [Candidatus Eisenbacteria bacterium]|nr:hypothetical protein [Candidatus Eisenbacteria bacterium]